MEKLRNEIENVIIRMAEAKHKEWQSKAIFLINNYDLILSVFTVTQNFSFLFFASYKQLQERDLSSLEFVQFQKLLDIKTQDFAQHHLNHSFLHLITFAKDYESLANASGNVEMEDRIGKKEGISPFPLHFQSNSLCVFFFFFFKKRGNWKLDERILREMEEWIGIHP